MPINTSKIPIKFQKSNSEKIHISGLDNPTEPTNEKVKKKVKNKNGKLKGTKLTVIYQSPEKKSKTYRICGPEKPECKKHKTKEKECEICEIKIEKCNILVKINGLDTNCPIYNDETTDVTGYKIEVKPGIGPVSLTGYAFEIEL